MKRYVFLRTYWHANGSRTFKWIESDEYRTPEPESFDPPVTDAILLRPPYCLTAKGIPLARPKDIVRLSKEEKRYNRRARSKMDAVMKKEIYWNRY